MQFVFRQSLLEETIDRGMRHWLANRIKNSLECFIVLRMKNPYETDALGPVGRSLRWPLLGVAAKNDPCRCWVMRVI